MTSSQQHKCVTSQPSHSKRPLIMCTTTSSLARQNLLLHAFCNPTSRYLSDKSTPINAQYQTANTRVRASTRLGSESYLQTQCDSRVMLRTEALIGKASRKAKPATICTTTNAQLTPHNSACSQVVYLLSTSHMLYNPCSWSGMSRGTEPLPVPERPQQAWQSPSRTGPSPAPNS